MDSIERSGYPKVLELRSRSGKLKGLRLLDRRSTVLQLEQVEAAVQRCDTIAKELGVPPYSETMEKLVQREEALKPYLDSCYGSAVVALAIAKGDIVHYRTLRAAEWGLLSVRPLVKSFIVPVVLIFFTALLGQWIGNSLQDRSFRHQRIFDLKRDRLVQGQQRAVDLYNDLEKMRNALALRELNGVVLATDLSDIETYTGRLESLRANSEGLVDKEKITSALVEAGGALKSYDACLRTKVGQQGEPTCARAFDLGKFRNIIYEFSDAITSFMEEPVQPGGTAKSQEGKARGAR